MTGARGGTGEDTARHPAQPARLILVRHGQTAHNHEGRLQGHADTPLDDTGHEQARRLAAHLLGLGIRAPTLHSSDLRRAHATAEALHRELGGTLHTFTDLREIFMGDWEGQRLDDLALSHPELHAQFWGGDPQCCAPGGETPQAAGERMYAHALAHWPAPGQTLVLVSHGIAISALLTRLLGLDYQAEFRSRRYLHVNTAYSLLTVDPVNREVLSAEVVQAGHLTGLEK